MKLLRERFNIIQQDDDEEISSPLINSQRNSQDNLEGSNPKVGDVISPIHESKQQQGKNSLSSERWNLVRDVVTAKVELEHSLEVAEKSAVKGEDDAILSQFWKDSDIPQPEPAIFPDDILLKFDEPSYEPKFQEDSEPVGLVISRVPETLVREKKQQLEAALFAEKEKLANDLKSKETDVVWREHLARMRVEKLEQEARERIENEKAKLSVSMIERERGMGREFRHAREELELAVRRQQAIVRERFGDVITSKDSIAREYLVHSTKNPQPVEMRIHIMRAVKTKLPKGAYLLMLTQYESLGGKPLAWSEHGLYGIGPDMPAVTRAVKHYGRSEPRNSLTLIS